MIVVTGNAPRSGTSAMMRALLEHYEPHSYLEQFPEYVAKERNPEGYWDLKKEHATSSDPIPTESGRVIKLWAPMFDRINVDDVHTLVYMQRNDFVKQVDSIRDTALAEGFTVDSDMIAKMFINQRNRTQEIFNKTHTIVVDMENFREDPSLFIDHIQEMVPCQ